jgi:hypothetical protein
MTVLPLALALLAQLPPQGAPADTASHPLPVVLGVVPDTVTVGDRFRAYLRVTLPPGARVEFSPLPPGDSLQLVDSVRVLDARGGAAAAYPLTAWFTGDSLAALAPLVVVLPGGERHSYRVPLRLPVVRSVLPDTGAVPPKPAKGFLFLPGQRPGRPWWPAAALVALLVAALLAWRLLRRAPGAEERLDPRTEALVRLEAIAATRERSTPDRLYAAVTRVLRDYLLRVDPRLGEDLTTSELLARVGHGDDAALDAPRLAALLHQADPVKFGGAIPGPGVAERFLDDARAWVEANPAAPAPRREAA